MRCDHSRFGRCQIIVSTAAEPVHRESFIDRLTKILTKFIHHPNMFHLFIPPPPALPYPTLLAYTYPPSIHPSLPSFEAQFSAEDEEPDKIIPGTDLHFPKHGQEGRRRVE